MLAPELVQRVKQLLAEGQLSYRRIARSLGLNRGTVLAIATGRRRSKTRKPKPDPIDGEALGPVRRCPDCGAMTMMPCLACRLRRRLKECQAAGPPAVAEDPLELDLRDKHHQRYAAIAARRKKEELVREAQRKARRTRADVERKRFRVVCRAAPAAHEQNRAGDPRATGERGRSAPFRAVRGSGCENLGTKESP